MGARGVGLWVSAACLLAASCKGSFTVPPEPGEGEGVRPRCGEISEPLSVTPVTATVGAGQLLVLQASGGTGNYRFGLVENVSGAEVDASTGLYVAGAPDPEAAGTVDVVRLEDRGCRGEAVASVEVVDAPRIAPSHVRVEPGETLTFEASGGSGDGYAFEVSTNVSGATIDDSGRYTAGSTLGRDVVRLTDTAIDATADAIVEVVTDASLRLAPSDWAVPLGAELELPLEGGSDAYDVEVSGSAIEHVGGTTVRAAATGRADVTFTDRFTGRSVVARVRSVAPQEAPREPPPDRDESHWVVGSADIDGDGNLDVVVAMPGANGERFESGTVLIYAGTGDGLDPEPARVLSGSGRDDEYGRGAALADLDEDGRMDLLVGARRADPTQRDTGAAYVYLGVDGGWFSETPSRSFFGSNGYDLFGDSIAVCDFNGDGVRDIAVSAPYADDPDGERDQGAIHVFLAYEPGVFLSSPDVEVFGQLPDGSGGWMPQESMNLGEWITAGDFDGDGTCDLVGYAPDPGVDVNGNGAVLIFRGRAAEGGDRGGPEELPSVLWTGDASERDDNRFGQRMAMGDVNGDGRDDLLVGRYLHDAGEDTAAGGMYLALGRELSGPASGITPIDDFADWSVVGDGSYAYYGFTVHLLDVDGDERADVVSGDTRGTIEESELSRPGLIHVWRSDGSLPSTRPDREYEGTQGDERFGLGVRPVGDVDGDGETDFVTFAPRHDRTDGDDDLGAAFLQPGDGSAPSELTVPREPSGQREGRAVAWIDLDGDPFPELAVGATQTHDYDVGTSLGAVRLYRGTDAGAEAAPFQTLGGYPGHADDDETGHALAVGDFDGDGDEDLLVVAAEDDLESELDDTVWDVGAGCGAAEVVNSGSVQIFLGAGDGSLESEPGFVFYGPEDRQEIASIAGGVDVNGDGLEDLIVGGRDWDAGGSNAGGFEVVFGRAPASDGRVVALCSADLHVDGDEEGAYLGSAVAPLGDLDGDGCDEWAVGAPEAEPRGERRSGAVRVYYGFGAACASTTTRVVVLEGTARDQWAGDALAGGVDLTGDGVADLLVGAPHFRDGRGEVGRVFLVSGAYVERLRAGAGRGAFVDALSDATLVVDGTSPGEQLGAALSVVPGAALLGGPYGGASGRVDTGGAVVFEVGANGFAEAPRLRMSGEAVTDGLLGFAVAARRSSTGVSIAVGAPWSSAAGVDDGAAFSFAME